MSAAPHPAGTSSHSAAQSAPAVPSALAGDAATKATQPAKAAKEKKDKKPKDASLAGQMANLELSPQPDFIQHRIDLFDKLYKEYNDYVAAQPRSEIKVTLPDGKALDATAWETSPMDIAKGISQSGYTAVRKQAEAV